MIGRRGFLGALLAAPAIVQFGSLMRLGERERLKLIETGWYAQFADDRLVRWPDADTPVIGWGPPIGRWQEPEKPVNHILVYKPFVSARFRILT